MAIIIPGENDTSKYAGPVQTPDQPYIPGSDVENPFNERHDVAATQDAIQQMLAGGTPNWVKWPHEYKALAKESYQAHREDSERMAAGYKWDDQATLTDTKARQVNGIGTRDFIERKLRANGIKCLVMVSDWVGAGGIPTVALWAQPPNRTNKIRFITSLDVPMMFEWSVLNLDQYGIPSGEKSIGWRNAACALVQKDIISEQRCHEIFGVPPGNAISSRYYRSLWEKRHGKPYVDSDDRDGVGA